MTELGKSRGVASPAPSAVRRWASQIGPLVAIVMAVLVAKGALAEPFYVPSASMEPTLLIGDALLASKFPYGYSAASTPLHINVPQTGRVLGALPKRGDVVVFRWPGDRAQVWVKRVVGVPGDRVQMRDARLYINGEAVALKPDGIGRAEDDDGRSRPAHRFVETLPGGAAHVIFKMTPYGRLDDTSEITVPDGHLFVMGDNRDNSADSRVSVGDGGVGLLSSDDLVGRVDAVVGSWDLGIRNQPIWTWPQGLRLSRFFTSVH